MSWKRHWAYFKSVMRHKLFVYQECRKLKLPILMALFHDWDKFLPDEWIPYARTFYSDEGVKQYCPDGTGFDVAWNKHQKRNKHHWQYWILTWDSGKTECLEMPEIYLKEMFADWKGAGRAYTGSDNTWDWYDDNKHKIQLHEKSRKKLEMWITK